MLDCNVFTLYNLFLALLIDLFVGVHVKIILKLIMCIPKHKKVN